MPTNRAPRSLQIYDPVLTNLARRYRPNGFIADQLLADQSTSVLSAQYPVFTKNFWFQLATDNEVTDRTPAREVDYEWSMESFLCKEYALKVSWSDLEAQQADGSLKLMMNKTEFLSLQMIMAHEARVAAMLKKVSAGTQGQLNLGAAPSNNWDVDAATIEADIKAGVLAIYDATGLVPNVMVVPYKVAYAMALQEDVRAILRSDATGQGVDYLQLGARILPAVIHGMRLIIPMGAQVTAGNEGASAPATTEIWGDDVRLLYVDTSAGWGVPTVAYKFNHTSKKVTRWRTVDPDINYVREFERYALKVVAPDTGYEIQDVLS